MTEVSSDGLLLNFKKKSQKKENQKQLGEHKAFEIDSNFLQKEFLGSIHQNNEVPQKKKKTCVMFSWTAAQPTFIRVSTIFHDWQTRLYNCTLHLLFKTDLFNDLIQRLIRYRRRHQDIKIILAILNCTHQSQSNNCVFCLLLNLLTTEMLLTAR